jgi:hypothetical protein
VQRKQEISPDDLRLGVGYSVLVDIPVSVDVLVQQIVAGERKGAFFSFLLFSLTFFTVGREGRTAERIRGE